MKSLVHIFHDLVHHHRHSEKFQGTDDGEQIHYLNQSFTISEDIKSDWKANARAGVALLAQQYRLARQEQGRSGSEEAYAQQAYSGYNGGTASRRRYREKN